MNKGAGLTMAGKPWGFGGVSVQTKGVLPLGDSQLARRRFF